MNHALHIDDLTIRVASVDGHRTVVDGVSLTVDRGESVGLVGESGSGKSMTARAVMGLLPRRAAVSGRIEIAGTSVLGAPEKELQPLRATRIAMIFQDPRAHINPVHPVGDFLTEGMRLRMGLGRAEAARRAVALLRDVGIPDGERRMGQHPHELSGGLLQRVMIAAALAMDPDLILADEPTTALDVTTQEEVMAILLDLRVARELAMVFITHDLELAAATCDRTAVMYAGRIVEEQRSRQLSTQPLHPYTSGLLRSRPHIDTVAHRLPVIPGRPLAAFEAGSGCAFRDRCAFAVPACATSAPTLSPSPAGDGHVACHRADEIFGDLPCEHDGSRVGA